MKGICDKCGDIGPIISRDQNGVGTCKNCYCHDESRHEICIWCNRKRPIALRTKYGNALCMVCLNTIRRHFTYLWARCAGCHEYKEVYGFTRDTGEPLCCKCKRRPPQANCQHPDRPVYSLGCCHTCYRRWRRQQAKNKKADQPAAL